MRARRVGLSPHSLPLGAPLKSTPSLVPQHRVQLEPRPGGLGAEPGEDLAVAQIVVLGLEGQVAAGGWHSGPHLRPEDFCFLKTLLLWTLTDTQLST